MDQEKQTISEVISLQTMSAESNIKDVGHNKRKTEIKKKNID